MKNKLFIPIIVVSFAVLPFFASAQATTTTNRPTKEDINKMRDEAKKEFEARKKELEMKREEFKKEMEERKEEIKNNLENRREEIKGKMEERKEKVKSEMEDKREENISKIKERVFKFTENVIERFEAAIERLEKLTSRIDSRITKMKAENIDVKKAEDLMVIAKIKIETAKTSVSGIKLNSQLVSSSTASTTEGFKADFQNLRTQLEKAKSDIKSAHASLVEVINNLKPGLNKTRATSTKPTTATTTATSTATTTNQ